MCVSAFVFSCLEGFLCFFVFLFMFLFVVVVVVVVVVVLCFVFVFIFSLSMCQCVGYFMVLFCLSVFWRLMGGVCFSEDNMMETIKD